MPLSLYRKLMKPILRSSFIGFFIGVVPGTGAVIASLVAYSDAKRTSDEPEKFGHGHPAGVAAPEAANNAAVPGALAPLLALGIPGSSTAAVLASALMIHGIQPGPLLFTKHAEIPYAIFASLLLGVPVMVAVGLLGVRGCAKLAQILRPLLASLIAVTCCLGAYSTANDMYPMYVMLAFGLAGYLLRKLHIPLGPLVLGFVLGDMLETNFRRSLLVAQGDLSIFLNHPITMVLLALTAVSITVAHRRQLRWSPPEASRNMSQLTDRLAQNIVQARPQDDAQATAADRKGVLDFLACALGGLGDRAVLALVAALPPNALDQATGASIFGQSVGRAEPGVAALVNGTLGHALDFDDVHGSVRGHPSTVVLPALFAATEVHGRSADQLIEAYTRNRGPMHCRRGSTAAEQTASTSCRPTFPAASTSSCSRWCSSCKSAGCSGRSTRGQRFGTTSGWANRLLVRAHGCSRIKRRSQTAHSCRAREA